MKTHLSKDQLDKFKKQLLQLREENAEKIDENREKSPNDSLNELADYDNHPGDMGTEQFEQERDAGLNLVREDRLREIDDALERIENGTFGLSEKSGKPIPEERLEVQPTARYLVEEQ